MLSVDLYNLNDVSFVELSVQPIVILVSVTSVGLKVIGAASAGTGALEVKEMLSIDPAVEMFLPKYHLSKQILI